MNRISRIKQKLEVLKPHYIEIVDETPKHKGHINQGDLAETHLTLKISSDIFNEIPLVMRHKRINDLLQDEFDKGLHALSIKII